MRRSSVEEVARVLKKLRDKHHDQIGAGELSELDAVIEQFETAKQSKGANLQLLEIADRALRIIGTAVRIINNLQDGL